jgi:hypothetical protein
MPSKVTDDAPSLTGHGAGRLSAVDVDTYNAELRDNEGLIGDRASGRAFHHPRWPESISTVKWRS